MRNNRGHAVVVLAAIFVLVGAVYAAQSCNTIGGCGDVGSWRCHNNVAEKCGSSGWEAYQYCPETGATCYEGAVSCYGENVACCR